MTRDLCIFGMSRFTMVLADNVDTLVAVIDHERKIVVRSIERDDRRLIVQRLCRRHHVADETAGHESRPVGRIEILREYEDLRRCLLDVPNQSEFEEGMRASDFLQPHLVLQQCVADLDASDMRSSFSKTGIAANRLHRRAAGQID